MLTLPNAFCYHTRGAAVHSLRCSRLWAWKFSCECQAVADAFIAFSKHATCAWQPGSYDNASFASNSRRSASASRMLIIEMRAVDMFLCKETNFQLDCSSPGNCIQANAEDALLQAHVILLENHESGTTGRLDSISKIPSSNNLPPYQHAGLVLSSQQERY